MPIDPAELPAAPATAAPAPRLVMTDQPDGPAALREHIDLLHAVLVEGDPAGDETAVEIAAQLLRLLDEAVRQGGSSR